MRLELAGPKCQAGGVPAGAADTWRLATMPGRWAGHTPGCSHLALDLPDLGLLLVC